jgi:hypothetical protein
MIEWLKFNEDVVDPWAGRGRPDSQLVDLFHEIFFRKLIPEFTKPLEFCSQTPSF